MPTYNGKSVTHHELYQIAHKLAEAEQWQEATKLFPQIIEAITAIDRDERDSYDWDELFHSYYFQGWGEVHLKQYTSAFIWHSLCIFEFSLPNELPISKNCNPHDLALLTKKLSELLRSEPIPLQLVNAFIKDVEELGEMLKFVPVFYNFLHKNILAHFHMMAWVHLHNHDFDTALTYFIDAVQLSVRYYHNADQIAEIGYNYGQFLMLMERLIGNIAYNRKDEFEQSKPLFEKLIIDLLKQSDTGILFDRSFKLAVNMPHASANLFNLFYPQVNASSSEAKPATDKSCEP